MGGQSQKRQVKSLEASRDDAEQNLAGSSVSVIHQTSGKENSFNNSDDLMGKFVARQNMQKAYSRVVSNKGAPGVDGMPVSELKEYLKCKWPEIREQLLKGEYHPAPVRRVEIAKPNGGIRKLGIPTVLDRLIQQGLQQILSSIFEPTFSKHSYGFRPGRSATQALKRAKSYVQNGARYVVDMDLEKFFDKVNHDLLIERVRRKVKDDRVITLIRRYLKAGVMENGIATMNSKGTPQGGPLSPLLSNIILTDLDFELERRGHNFCRYADDCNIYVKSEKAGNRVLKSITKFVESKLKLKVNREKSAVDRPWKRKFLGYSLTSQIKSRLRVHKDSIRKFKTKVKQLCRIGRGMNIRTFIKDYLNPVIRGWSNYFKDADTTQFAKALDTWLRHRIRVLLWRQWSKPKVRYRKLCALGVDPKDAHMLANVSKGPWRMCHRQSKIHLALSVSIMEQLGLKSVFKIINRC